MKTLHYIHEQYKRLDAENFRLLSAARWKSLSALAWPETAAKYDAIREHYAKRSALLRSCYLSVLHKYGERCRAAGMRWDYNKEDYV